MTELDLEFKGAFDRRRWRRLRDAAVGTNIVSTVAAASVAGIVLVAEDQTSLGDVWQVNDGTLIKIYHLGRRVTSHSLNTDEDGEGGEYFNVTIEQDTLSGLIWTVRQDDGTACPQLPTYRRRPVELRILDKGNRLEGRWLNWPFDFESCSITDRWEFISMTRYQAG